MRTNENNYAPDLYIKEITYETPEETPTEFIINKLEEAYKEKDKKQVDVLIDILFEMQIFWVDYDYELDYLYSTRKSCSRMYLHTHSDAYCAIAALDNLFNDLECIKKLLPFVNTRYKEVTIESIFNIIGYTLYKKNEIPDYCYQQALQLAKDILVDKPLIYHKLNRYTLHDHIKFKAYIIENLTNFKKEDTHPILNHIISNEQENDIIIKVAKGVISGKFYPTGDIPL